MSLTTRLRRMLHLPPEPQISYAQSGEDLIIAFIFDALGRQRPTYFDLGAHHPVQANNTYLFYRRGARGVAVEPNRARWRDFQQLRPHDISLNCGVSASGRGKTTFFHMAEDTLSTFDPEIAAGYQVAGHPLVGTVEVELMPIATLVAEHGCPDLLSLDVEGPEAEILSAWDMHRERPAVCCIETLTFSSQKQERKRQDLIALMETKGYFAYGDTYINTIFVDRDAWRKR